MSYRFAVLGDPVSHSRSPQIHSVMASLTGLEVEYERVLADRRRLGEEILRLRRGGWDGLNITMPLKGAAAAAADHRSLQVSRSASANTLVMREGKVYAHSTDSLAARELVDSSRFAHRAAILVLGAGASARAILAALDDTGPIYVAARRSVAADELTGKLDGEVLSWGTAVAEALVVNTTPLGMQGEALPEGVLEVAAGLIDLPYGSEPTPAVIEARELGIPVAPGQEFLLRQAIESFRIWTGRAPKFELVEQGLEKI